MATQKLCRTVQMIHLHDVDSLSATDITPIDATALQTFTGFGVSTFEESQGTADGNQIINQVLKFNTKQDVVSFLRLGNPCIMVLKLTFHDDTIYIYGSIDNPVTVSYSRSQGMVSVTGARQCAEPEF